MRHVEKKVVLASHMWQGDSQLDELRDGLVLGGSEGQCSDDTSPGGSVKGVKISGKGLLNKVKQASFGGCEGCKQGLSY